MITKHDWDEALESWVAGERERLGGPPSPEDVVAFLSGALPRVEAERVQALLVYYPELTPLLHECAAPPRVRIARLHYLAIAAMFVLAVLSALLVREHRKNGLPIVQESPHELTPLQTRSAGGPASELRTGARRYLLTLVPSRPPAERAYTLEIERDGRVLWRAEDVHPAGGRFALSVPGEFFEPGTYRLHLYAGGRIVDRYVVTVVPGTTDAR